MSKLSDREIKLLVEYYIGVDVGYLGGFRSRAKLEEFYQVDCDLDIIPTDDTSQTIKEQFIDILKSQSARSQAAILRAALRKYYQRFDGFGSQSNQDKLYGRFENAAKRLESQSEMVDAVSISPSSETVRRALEEAATAIRRGNASSAVDRTHTALHGYLKEQCAVSGIQFDDLGKVTLAFKAIRKNHPAFQNRRSWPKEVDRTLQGLATALDAINTLRNHASLAHSSPDLSSPGLLAEPEATLAVNAARSILLYVNDKLQEYTDNEERQAKTAAIVDIPF
ncbi:MAG: abortive infection family protein [Chloroflexi bacterium]|nr:abortive infection family protein [Chloroflexota bacterium]